MNKQTGILSTYIALLTLISITAVFYLISITVKNSVVKKLPLPITSSIPVTSPVIYTSPTIFPSISPSTALFVTPLPLSSPVSKTITNSLSKCTVSGCSGELCVSKDLGPINSTCEYKEEYSCLKYATCEMQTNNSCGWTNTPEYNRCLSNIQNPQIGF